MLGKQNHTTDQFGMELYYDNLTYTGNQLKAVDDATTYEAGFQDGAELTTEYTYDKNGNLLTDSNKSITGITYNALNLPKQITFSGGDKINYTYDASGTRLKQQVTVSGSVSQTYDYVGSLLFDNGKLAEVSHAQGRLRADILGKDYSYDYQYFLTDHLGNTRAMIAPLERKYVAGMESSRSAQENAQFLYINETRYTGQARTGSKSAMLNAAANKVLGPSKGLKVYNGDQVEMKVWGKYTNTSNALEVAATNMLLSALSAAFGVSSSSTGESLQLYNAFNGQLGGSTYTLFNQAPGDIPKAHLNYLFFDLNYNYVSGGFVQVSTTSYSRLTNSFTADRDGYLFVYLANESTLNANVYFDDLEIKHTSADALLQSDDYYPFGLPMNNGFQEAGIRPNRFLYQGKEWQKTLSLHLYDFHARQFDPALGRFLSADAASQFASPYVGMGNVPVMMVDPDGNFAVLGSIVLGKIIGSALIGAGINAAAYTASVAFSNGGFSNWSWGQFGSAVGSGAISGAATAGIGQAFGAVGSIGKELGRAGAHALAGGSISKLGGGDFWSGAAAGFIGSGVGSATHNFKPHWQIAGSALSSGLGAKLGGGDFLQGAAMGGIIAGVNHLAHRDPYRRIKRIARKSGAKYFTDKKEFYDYLWENSFNENGEAIREVSGWELENGDAIALPYDKNTLDHSEWGALKTGTLKRGGIGVQFKDRIYKLKTSTHTHPQNRYSSDGRLYAPKLSTADKIHISNTRFKTINVLYNRNLYQLGSGFRKKLGSWR